MARLLVKKQAAIIASYDLETMPSIISIGSARDNTIVLDDERVSKTQCEIRNEPGQFIIRDTRSAQGTFLNGVRVASIAPLRNGDEISCGNHLIIFELEQDETVIHPLSQLDVETDEKTVLISKETLDDQAESVTYEDKTIILSGEEDINPDDQIEPNYSAETIILPDKTPREPESLNISSLAGQPIEQSDTLDNEKTVMRKSEDLAESQDDKTIIQVDHLDEEDEATVLVPNKYDQGEDDGHSPAKTRKTPISPFTPEKEVQEVDETLTIGHEDVPDYDLLAIYGPYRGRRYPLLKDKTRIGRDEHLNDIILNQKKNEEIDKSISGRHATIIAKNSRYYLSDKRSKAGTYLNQKKLLPEDALLLNDNDEIEIVSSYASTIFRFVPKDQINFSSPRKAGVWWIRFRWIIDYILVALLTIIGIVFIINAFGKDHTSGKAIALKVTAEIIDNYNNSRGTDYYADSEPQNKAVPTPFMGDMDGDGFYDIVFIDATGTLVCFNLKTRSELWKQKGDNQSGFEYSVLADDLDENGDVDLLVSDSNSRIYAFSGKEGRMEWASEPLGGNITNQPSAADLNGDNIKDIIVVMQRQSVVVGWSEPEGYVWRNYPHPFSLHGIPSVADVDDDGIREIAIGTYDGKIVVFSAKDMGLTIYKIIDVNGQLNQSFDSWGEDNSIHNAIVMAPKSNATLAQKIILASTREFRVLAFDPNAEKRLWAQKLEPSRFSAPLHHASPVASDLNKDNVWEVIVPSFGASMAITAYSISGKAEDSPNKLWQFDLPYEDGFVSSPALADVNEDGVTDIIASSVNGHIYFLHGHSGEVLAHYEAPKSAFTSSPLVAPLDEESNMGVVVVDDNFNIHLLLLNSYMPSSQETWNQFLGNTDHSGQYFTQRVSKPSRFLTLFFGILLIGSGVFYLCKQIWSIKKIEMQYRKNLALP